MDCKEGSVFRKSSPLLATSFVNRCGTIGLSILPMLLVDRKLSPDSSAAVMTLVKGASLAGAFLGGWLSDRIGLRLTLIVSFLLSGVGLGLLPFQNAFLALAVFGILAQLGQSVFPSSARLMITKLIPVSGQQEATGWLRTVNNAGQVVSYLLGWGLAGIGIPGLMLIDSSTSVVAAMLGWKALAGKEAPANSEPAPDDPAPAAALGREDALLLWMNTLVTTGFMFLYEFFMVSTAAKFRILYAAHGLTLFSQVMLINTVLCGFLSVAASRKLKDPTLVLPFGIFLAMSGCFLALAPDAGSARIFAGTFVLTLGEIVFMALSGYVTLRLIQQPKNQGMLFGAVLVVQTLGRIAGSAAAFPLAVHGAHPEIPVATVGALSLALCWLTKAGLAGSLRLELEQAV
jgi:MFS family permease